MEHDWSWINFLFHTIICHHDELVVEYKHYQVVSQVVELMFVIIVYIQPNCFYESLYLCQFVSIIRNVTWNSVEVCIVPMEKICQSENVSQMSSYDT